MNTYISRLFLLLTLGLIGCSDVSQLGTSLYKSVSQPMQPTQSTQSGQPTQSGVPIGCKSPVDNLRVIHPLEGGWCREGEIIVYGNPPPQQAYASQPMPKRHYASQMPNEQFVQRMPEQNYVQQMPQEQSVRRMRKRNYVQQIPQAQSVQPMPEQPLAPQGKTRLHVDLSQRQVHVYRGEAYIASFEVGGGLNNSPVGEFTVIEKEITTGMYDGYDWQAVMGAPEWIGIHKTADGKGIYGFHGPESGLYNGGLGCFRMNPSDLRQLYGMVEIGTPVSVTP